MQEKIKIVFNWIGPRGPIWNTEIPSVYSFANAAEHTQLKTHYWFGDDTWMKMFKDKEMFEMAPSVSIIPDIDNRPFIYPYNLSWRTPFQFYFNGRNGIFEFSHISRHLLPLVVNNNGYILIDYSVEAFMDDAYLTAMHGYFHNINHIPLHKIIFLTGCMNANFIYDQYCIRKNIPNDKNHRLTIITYPSSYQIFTHQINSGESVEPIYNENFIPEKLFLSWNRRFRNHRIELALSLEKNNLIDRTYISFERKDIEEPARDTLMDRLSNSKLQSQYGDIISRFVHRLPLILDGEHDINTMCADHDNKNNQFDITRKYYQNSLISIITETNFYEREVSLTEKSFKPCKEKHPFIIVGVTGTLNAMRELGFRTFDEFWDESYDTINDPDERMARISDIIAQIGQWSNEQILDFRRRVKPILEHNYNQLKIPSLNIVLNKIITHIQGNYVS